MLGNPPLGYPWARRRQLETGGALAQGFGRGDRAKWSTPQGETDGKVKRKLTSTTEVGGQKVNAWEDDPRYVVESEKSGSEAAHKPGSLSKA